MIIRAAFEKPDVGGGDQGDVTTRTVRIRGGEPDHADPGRRMESGSGFEQQLVVSAQVGDEVSSAAKFDEVDALDARALRRFSCGVGSKGQKPYDRAFVELASQSAEETTKAPLVRRPIADPAVRSYYLCRLPRGTTPEELVRVVDCRRSIERRSSRPNRGSGSLIMGCGAGAAGTGTSRWPFWRTPSWRPCASPVHRGRPEEETASRADPADGARGGPADRATRAAHSEGAGRWSGWSRRRCRRQAEARRRLDRNRGHSPESNRHRRRRMRLIDRPVLYSSNGPARPPEMLAHGVCSDFPLKSRPDRPAPRPPTKESAR